MTVVMRVITTTNKRSKDEKKGKDANDNEKKRGYPHNGEDKDLQGGVDRSGKNNNEGKKKNRNQQSGIRIRIPRMRIRGIYKITRE